MRLSPRILCVFACGFFSFSAPATPVTWSLVGVTFEDGGTASGSFTYDADTNTYNNVSITTTPGSVVLTGATFQFVNPLGPPGPSVVLFGASNLPDLTGTRAMVFGFASPLSNAGGTVAFLGAEVTCLNATCNTAASPFRFTTAGAVQALFTALVPTLSTWAMLMTALLLSASAFLALRRPAV